MGQDPNLHGSALDPVSPDSYLYVVSGFVLTLVIPSSG
jgi:hypothetical protein